MSILISFLNLLLYIAIIVFIAFVIVWVIQSFMGWSIDAPSSFQTLRLQARPDALALVARLRLDVGKDGRAQVVVRGTPLPMPGDQPATQTAAAPAPGGPNAPKTDIPIKPTAAMPPVTDDSGTAATKPSATATTEPAAMKPAGTSEETITKAENVDVKLKVNDNDVQFARASMRRQANNEVREARWNSYSDTGSVA